MKTHCDILFRINLNSDNKTTKSVKSQMRILTLSSLFILMLATLFPKTVTSQTIKDFSTVLSETNNRGNNYTELYSLYYDNQPSIIVKASKTIHTQKEQSPKVLEIDVSDLKLFNTKDIKLASIELIRIIYNKDSELSVLNLSQLSTLKQLKAIVIQCDFNCTPNDIKSFIEFDTEDTPSIYYLISIPQ